MYGRCKNWPSQGGVFQLVLSGKWLLPPTISPFSTLPAWPLGEIRQGRPRTLPSGVSSWIFLATQQFSYSRRLRPVKRLNPFWPANQVVCILESRLFISGAHRCRGHGNVREANNTSISEIIQLPWLKLCLQMRRSYCTNPEVQ